MRSVHGELIDEPIPRHLWSLDLLRGPKLEFAYKAVDFAEEHFIGPFVVSNDILHDWLLFFNHKEYGRIYTANLNRLASITKLSLNSDLQPAISFLLADILDHVGVVVSRGQWIIGLVHIYCDDMAGWSWRMKTDVQRT